MSQMAGRTLEGFEEFGVSDRNGLAPGRVALHLGMLHCALSPSRQRFLQAIKSIDIQQSLQLLQIDDPVPHRRLPNLPKA